MEDEFNNSLTHQLHRASQLSDELFNAEAADQNITPRQYAVLSAVAANNGLSQTRIVNSTGIDRSTVADIVRRMIQTNLLLRRRTKDDARAYSVTVTEHGQEILQRASESNRRAEEALLARLAPGYAEVLKSSLAMLLAEAS